MIPNPAIPKTLGKNILPIFASMYNCEKYEVE
jgi:hypothetical protein